MPERRVASVVLAGTVIFIACSLGKSDASPNGLTQIPIAKVFGDGVAAFSIARAAESSQSTVYTTQYGLFNVLEVGVDYQAAPTNQSSFLGNAKLLLFHHPGHLPDIACGLQNIASGQKPVPYIVATTQPKATGFSIGAIRQSVGGYYGMFGLSYNINPNFQIVADEIAGSSNYSTLGFVTAVTKDVTFNLAYARPNGSANSDTPNGYIANISYVFHLKGGAKASGTEAKPTSGGAGAG